jgi:hypothetical protein
VLPARAEPEPDRDELAREREELGFARDEADFARAEPDFARDEPDFVRDELAFDRDELDRLLPPLDLPLPERDELERERDELELRELLDERRRELDDPLRRSAAGISSRATAFTSCGICFWRKFAIRSSSRRIDFASFAVSLSPTLSASASIAVYWPISWNSSVSSVRAFFHIFSDPPVPRSAWSGPCAAATALLASEVAVPATGVRAPGPLGPASAFPPSCLMRRSTWRAWLFVSFR